MNIIGGNSIRSFRKWDLGINKLASQNYDYFVYKTKPNELVTFPELKSCAILLNSFESRGTCCLNGEATVQPGSVILSDNRPFTLKFENTPCLLFVAGVKQAHVSISSLQILNPSEVKKVVKPWGHEMWLNGEHPHFTFKSIFIKAGTRTSLQYHRSKSETHLLYQGSVKLHYKSNANISNDDVGPTDISTLQLEAISSIDVTPNILHRLEAITDSTLFEVSTPHLDDVVRVSDDTARGHGRIPQEHQ